MFVKSLGVMHAVSSYCLRLVNDSVKISEQRADSGRRILFKRDKTAIHKFQPQCARKT